MSNKNWFPEWEKNESEVEATPKKPARSLNNILDDFSKNFEEEQKLKAELAEFLKKQKQ